MADRTRPDLSDDRDGPLASSLTALAKAEAACTRCPLYQHATQVVPGEGPRRALILFVGEQPDDREDQAGRPFVGPAGKLFDRALQDAGIERAETFVTNAVKHFKSQMRGKRRLHSKPNVYEIERCNWWLEQERGLVQPRLIVALGATAARALTGRTIKISSVRGQLQRLPDETALVITVHPSSLLRVADAQARASAYEAFVKDLAKAQRLCAETR